MRQLCKLLPLLLLLLSTVTSLRAQTVRIATYNIKYDDTNDQINNWSVRKTEVSALIKYHKFEIFGVQEALHHQLQDIKKELTGFEYVGAGRDDGKKKGEYSALFYNQKNYQLLKSGTFWLSKSPDRPSKDWDAALPRICTWTRLKHRLTQKEFFVFNTHFDHRGVKAREESAKVILEQISQLAQNVPVVLIGDFNFESDDTPYRIITKIMADSYKNSQNKPYGPIATFNGFRFDQLPEKRIDYIFIMGDVYIMSYATLADSQEMRYPSDHFPVVTDLKFK